MSMAKNMMASLGALGAFLGFGAAPTTANYNRSRRPTGAALRNPADPVQAARIEAAAAKRQRKADNAQHQAMRSDMFNTAHRQYAANFESLTSTFVAK